MKSTSASSSSATRLASAADVPARRISAYRSSRCCATSSRISASRDAGRFRSASRWRSSAFQSGMFELRDPSNRVDELFPGGTLRPQHRPALGGDAVIAAAPFARALDPASLNPPALFEPVEQRIERRRLEPHAAERSLLDELADLVAVSRAMLDERQCQQRGAAFLELAVERRSEVHM